MSARRWNPVPVSARPSNQGERVAALEASQCTQDREIRDVKGLLSDIDHRMRDVQTKIDQFLLIESDLKWVIDAAKEQRGAAKFGKMLMGAGFFATLGASLLGVYHFFAGRGLP